MNAYRTSQSLRIWGLHAAVSTENSWISVSFFCSFFAIIASHSDATGIRRKTAPPPFPPRQSSGREENHTASKMKLTRTEKKSAERYLKMGPPAPRSQRGTTPFSSSPLPNQVLSSKPPILASSRTFLKARMPLRKDPAGMGAPLTSWPVSFGPSRLGADCNISEEGGGETRSFNYSDSRRVKRHASLHRTRFGEGKFNLFFGVTPR